MIAMLLGDGSISSTNGFRMTHCEKQKDYLIWKIKKLNSLGIKNCGLKSYISTKGYKVGEVYYYTRLSVIPFTKVLRRVFYKKTKVIANRKMLNRLDSLGLAIWYMDDGHISFKKIKDKNVGLYIKIALCLPKSEIQVIIDFFKEVWGIQFYTFSEGKGTYSICCGTLQGIKFINIIKSHVMEIPCMQYKISYNLDGRLSPVDSSESKWKTPLIKQSKGEDMIWSSLKNEAVYNGLGLTTLSEQNV